MEKQPCQVPRLVEMGQHLSLCDQLCWRSGSEYCSGNVLDDGEWVL